MKTKQSRRGSFRATVGSLLQFSDRCPRSLAYPDQALTLGAAAPTQPVVHDAALDKLEKDLAGKLFLGGAAPSNADAAALEAVAGKSTRGYPRVTGWHALASQFAPAAKQTW